MVHGIACWFDVLFDGSSVQRWLSTAPGQPTTHWYPFCAFDHHSVPPFGKKLLSAQTLLVAGCYLGLPVQANAFPAILLCVY